MMNEWNNSEDRKWMRGWQMQWIASKLDERKNKDYRN